MDNRERLVELIKRAVGGTTDYWAGLIADMLLAHDEIGEPKPVTDCHGFGKWIPVSERLPDVNKTKSGYESVGVIVCVAGYKKSAYRIYERAVARGKTVYRWKFPWDRISDENITHWMPLPQPPKGE